jgi:hypothetical protein
MGDENFGPQQLLKMMAMHPNFDLIIASVNIPGMGGPPPNPNRPPGKGGPPPWANAMSIDDVVDQYKQINDYKPVLGLIQDRSPDAKDMNDPREEQRWKNTCEVTAKFIGLKIPYYPTISRAAVAASKVIGYYQMRQQ